MKFANLCLMAMIAVMLALANVAGASTIKADIEPTATKQADEKATSSDGVEIYSSPAAIFVRIDYTDNIHVHALGDAAVHAIHRCDSEATPRKEVECIRTASIVAHSAATLAKSGLQMNGLAMASEHVIYDAWPQATDFVTAKFDHRHRQPRVILRT